MFDYVSHISVSIAIATDGREWMFFHPTGEGNWQEHKIHLDLSIQNSQESAQRLQRYLCIERDGCPRQDYKPTPCGHYRVLVVADTPGKGRTLDQIADKLGRQLTVELVPKD